MSARRDVQNALSKSKRRARAEVPVEDVEKSPRHRNTEGEEPASPPMDDKVIDSIVARDALEAVYTDITDPVDRRILNLMLQGERRTTAYVKVLALQDRDPKTQQRIVKRYKDRLVKRVQRLGVVIRAQRSS